MLGLAGLPSCGPGCLPTPPTGAEVVRPSIGCVGERAGRECAFIDAAATGEINPAGLIDPAGLSSCVGVDIHEG